MTVDGNIYSTNVYAQNTTLNTLTENRALISDASKNITSSSITDTELGYLDGVTSNIQTQIDNVNPPELAYLDGLTGNVQDQLDNPTILYNNTFDNLDPPLMVTKPIIIIGTSPKRFVSDPVTIDLPYTFAQSYHYSITTSIHRPSDDGSNISVYITNKTTSSFTFRTISNKSPTTNTIEYVIIGHGPIS